MNIKNNEFFRYNMVLPDFHSTKNGNFKLLNSTCPLDVVIDKNSQNSELALDLNNHLSKYGNLDDGDRGHLFWL